MRQHRHQLITCTHLYIVNYYCTTTIITDNHNYGNNGRLEILEATQTSTHHLYSFLQRPDTTATANTTTITGNHINGHNGRQ